MKKGITLASLMGTLVIMVILVTSVIVTTDNIKNTTYKKSFAEEMYSIKNLVEEYEFLYSKYPVKDVEIEFDLSTINTNDKEQFNGEVVIDNKIKFREIDYSRAGVSKLSKGMKKNGDKDCYVFSEDTKKIYYLKGEEIGDNMYYTLTSELYLELGISNVN